jgi:hypothetical protein
MLNRLLLIVLMPLALTARAQVTVSVQLPPGGMVQKDQLWNMVLVNNQNQVLDATVSLDIQDAVTGQTIFSAVGNNFLLGKGVKIVGLKDIQPVQYNYIAAELSGNYIPLGSYIACYRVMRNDIKATPLGDECVRINISPLSPPLLHTPADQSELEMPYPQFSWQPPTPIDMFTSLEYDLLVAEVLPGQSPTEAILYNTPIYSNQLRTVYDVYPASFSRLSEGRQYAWQVTARNGLNYAAKTETWSFRIKPKDSAKVEITTAGYILLKSASEASGLSTVGQDELLLKYYSFESDREVSIRISTTDNTPVRELKQKIRYGDNFIRIKLGKEFKSGSIYTIELTDLQGRPYSARFIIK